MAVIKLDYSFAVDRNSPEGRAIIANASRIAYQIAENAKNRSGGEPFRRSGSTSTPPRSGAEN